MKHPLDNKTVDWVQQVVKCVVPVSGGKDSQTCLELAIEHFGKESVIGLFCDTQFEHPMTYEHIENMCDLYQVEIIVRNDGNVLDQCIKWGRFPSDNVNFCTNYLKINVGKKFYKELAEQQGCGFEVWYGLRSAESQQREKRYGNKINDELYAPHEIMPSKYPKYLEKLGVMMRLPIIDWMEKEVFEFLGSKINPLYSHGFNRVGCFPCLAGGDGPKEKAFQFDSFGQSQLKKVREVEKVIGKSVFTSKGASQRNNEAQLCMFCQI